MPWLQANRALRQSSLLALNSTVASYSQGMSAQSFTGVITELSPLVRWVPWVYHHMWRGFDAFAGLLGSPGMSLEKSSQLLLPLVADLLQCLGPWLGPDHADNCA